MYLWVQAQRAVKAGNAANRKPLTKEREELLESINFVWIGQNNTDEIWEEKFNELKNHMNDSGNLILPTHIEGKLSSLYTWWTNQKVNFINNKLTVDRFQKFKEIGLDLSLNVSTGGRDGFTKWAKGLNEIHNFIKREGHYPKPRENKEETSFYDRLGRTKRAFKNDELSDKQLELIEKLNIDMK